MSINILILPILIPLVAGLLAILIPQKVRGVKEAIALIATRQVDVRPFVTDQVRLDDFPKAFKDLAGGVRMKVLGVP